MPIPTKAWAACDGSLYPTPEMATRRDLFVVLTEHAGMNSESAGAVIDQLIKHADVVVAALTTGPTSRPSTRKRAGTTSPRRAAKRATEAQAQAGFKGMRESANGIVACAAGTAPPAPDMQLV